ncbi:MAG: hypothetical protein KME22_16700 [Hassallia sp. WJT32-NPBG1]|nr:hypothetical protein [Hassallia sp. WJT32-NPBG1]
MTVASLSQTLRGKRSYAEGFTLQFKIQNSKIKKKRIQAPKFIYGENKKCFPRRVAKSENGILIPSPRPPRFARGATRFIYGDSSFLIFNF